MTNTHTRRLPLAAYRHRDAVGCILIPYTDLAGETFAKLQQLTLLIRVMLIILLCGKERAGNGALFLRHAACARVRVLTLSVSDAVMLGLGEGIRAYRGFYQERKNLMRF